MTTTGKILTGFLTGTLLGSILGVLYAPEKGKKTRTLISDNAKKASDSIEKTITKAKEAVGV